MGMFSDALSDFSSAPTTPAPQGGGDSRFGAALSDLSPNPADVESYIRDAATKRGIDPEVALKVYRSEGGAGYTGDRGSSFGPFQLHYGGVAPGGNAVSGLGDTFTSQTGLDARNPATWRQQVDFSLDQAKSGGWGPWHGWKGDQWAGIGDRGYGATYGGPTGAPRIDIAPPRTAGTVNPAIDFAKSFPGGAVAGLSSVLSATGQAAQAEMGQPIDVPAPQQVNAALQQVTGPLPLPQGPGGEYGRTIGQFVAQAPFSPPIPGMGPVGAAVTAAGAGFASETAGRAAAGTPFEGAARVVAPAVSGLITRRPAAITEAQALRVGQRTAEIPATQELLTTGAGQMNAAKAAGAKTYTRGEMTDFADHLEQTLRDSDLEDYAPSAPGVFRTIQKLRDKTDLAGIQKVRSLLGRMGAGGGDEPRAVQIAQGEIDKFLGGNEPNAAAALEEGRQNYAAGKRAQDADAREQIATLRQKRAGYGGNARFVAATRSILSPIVEKAIKFNQRNGLSDEEIGAMQDIIEGTTLTNSLRNFGMVSPEKGILSTAVFGELAEKLGGKIAGAIAGASWLSNKLNTDITMGQISRLNEMIRKRSPLYQQAVRDAGSRYIQTMDDFAASPSRQAFVKFLVASRNLSAGLRKDGIPLSSGDLLKAIEAPANNQGGTNQ